jgi:hypothetical protein
MHGAEYHLVWRLHNCILIITLRPSRTSTEIKQFVVVTSNQRTAAG